MRHRRRILISAIYPILVVIANEATKLLIGLILLILQNLSYALIARRGEFDVPRHELAIYVAPLFESRGVLHHLGNTTKLSTIIRRSLLGYKLLGMNMFLDQQQHLTRIHGLDDIVGNF